MQLLETSGSSEPGAQWKAAPRRKPYGTGRSASARSLTVAIMANTMEVAPRKPAKATTAIALRFVRKGSSSAETGQRPRDKGKEQEQQHRRQNDGGHLGQEGKQAQQEEDGHLRDAGHPVEVIDEIFCC